jgi:hypothetical protein
LQTITDRLRRKLSRTLIRGAVLALATAAVAVFAVPSAAQAEDDYYKDCGYTNVSCQTGVEVGGPQGACMTASPAHHYTRVCIDYDGDYVYVWDGLEDTLAAMAFIRTDQGDVIGRHCRNNHGAGTWARCDFDWVEGAEKIVFAGYKEDYNTMYVFYLWEFSNK